ncbi:unnamed protein product [Ascophyllum nodosum]
MPKPFTSNTGRRDALHKVVFTIKQELNNMVTRNVGLTCVRETSGYGRRAWRHDDVPGVQGCHDGGDDPGLLLGRLPQQISCCHHESGRDEPAQHACRARLRSSGSRANIRYQGGAATVGRIPQSFIDKIQSTRIRSEDSVHTLQVTLSIYVDIVFRNLCDTIPKLIRKLLVCQTIAEMGKSIVDRVSTGDLASLLSEDRRSQRKRTKVIRRSAQFEEAVEIISKTCQTG